MKEHKHLIAYISIGLAIYFLIIQLQLPFFDFVPGFHSIIAIIGISFIIQSQTKNAPTHLLFGTFFIGISIHLFCLQHFTNWIDYWAIYLLLLSVSILLYYLQTKKKVWTGIILLCLSIILILSHQFPETFDSILFVLDFIDTFWPVALLIYGVLLLRRSA